MQVPWAYKISNCKSCFAMSSGVTIQLQLALPFTSLFLFYFWMTLMQNLPWIFKQLTGWITLNHESKVSNGNEWVVFAVVFPLQVWSFHFSLLFNNQKKNSQGFFWQETRSPKPSLLKDCAPELKACEMCQWFLNGYFVFGFGLPEVWITL